MAKLTTLPLEELYSRKITPAVERVIISKEDFSSKATSWCNCVCKLKYKNPPPSLFAATPVDILIIQDYKAFDDISFRKYGASVEKKTREIIDDIFVRAAGKNSNITYDVTSLLKCQLGALDIKQGKAPTPTVLSKCKPYLLQEIEVRKPKVIISLTTASTKVLASKVSNNGNRGEILTTLSGVPLVLTFHPRILTMLRQNSSGAFWGPDFYSVILTDFGKAISLVRGKLKVPNLKLALEKAGKKITVARDIQAVGLMVDSLMEMGLEGSVLSFDLETNTLDPYGVDPYGQPAKIILAQFGFKNAEGEKESFVFPLWHRNNTWYDPDEAWIYIKDILSNPEVRKIGHHIKFDIRFTAVTTGVRVHGVIADTMLLLHAINSGVQGQYSLKQAVWDRLPDMELGNYEDQLPRLTKPAKDQEGEEDAVEDATEDEENGNHSD